MDVDGEEGGGERVRGRVVRFEMSADFPALSHYIWSHQFGETRVCFTPTLMDVYRATSM